MNINISSPFEIKKASLHRLALLGHPCVRGFSNPKRVLGCVYPVHRLYESKLRLTPFSLCAWLSEPLSLA